MGYIYNFVSILGLEIVRVLIRVFLLGVIILVNIITKGVFSILGGNFGNGGISLFGTGSGYFVTGWVFSGLYLGKGEDGLV